ncbi:MAG TPA: L-aspartate oxidase [Gammaproteobacteria bacterium]|nr:L-aspartate oxidase [Gammaproteobacteria bacterium]
MSKHISTDVLIVGSGAAGLTTALKLAPYCTVSVLSKGQLSAGSTLYAQGGVAAVTDRSRWQSHIEDTLNAGVGLCHQETVEFCVRRGQEAVEWLIDQGVGFTTEKNHEGATSYHLTQEGGHSERRIFHVDDATGKAVETTLEQQARAHPNIHIYEHRLAIDLITAHKLGGKKNRCLGLYALNCGSTEVETFVANHVVLATGGAAQAYLYSSNPDTATGDGIAMAWRAGCRITNMEFMQFHPTCLYHPKAKSFLLTEALRGEGATLHLPNGERFMAHRHAQAELAPRDIVARTIDHEMKRHGLEFILLDISHKKPEFVRNHFPNLYQKCLEYGFDLTQEPVPVVPAAHYTCGGIMTNLHAETDLPGLYAVGETACTGLHGANRMASNSILECLVFAGACAERIQAQLLEKIEQFEIPAWDETRVTDSDEQVVVSHNWHELRRFMWDYVGIVRTNKRLERAKRRVELLRMEANEYYGNFKVNRDLLELRNLVDVSNLIIRSAMSRKESRGLHYTLDYPAQKSITEDTILVPSNFHAHDALTRASA